MTAGGKLADAGSKNCIRFSFYRGNFCGCGLYQRSARRGLPRRFLRGGACPGKEQFTCHRPPPTTFFGWVVFLLEQYGPLFLRGAGMTMLIAISGTILGFLIGLLGGAIARTIELGSARAGVEAGRSSSCSTPCWAFI